MPLPLLSPTKLSLALATNSIKETNRAWTITIRTLGKIMLDSRKAHCSRILQRPQLRTADYSQVAEEV